MGWLIAAVLLLAILLLPISIRLAYGAAGARVLLGIGPIRIPVFPKNNTRKKERNKSGKSPSKTPSKKTVDQGGKLSDFLPLLETILELAAELHRRLVVADLCLRIRMAGDDPCDLGIQYGRAWAALGSLIPHLERLFTIKKREIDISCDYTSGQSSVLAHAILRISIGRLLWIAIFHGRHVLKQYFKIYNQRKGGSNT